MCPTKWANAVSENQNNFLSLSIMNFLSTNDVLTVKFHLAFRPHLFLIDGKKIPQLAENLFDFWGQRWSAIGRKCTAIVNLIQTVRHKWLLYMFTQEYKHLFTLLN